MADVFLPGSFLQQARGFTFKDSTGVTWTFDQTTHELSLAITAGAVGSFDESVQDVVGSALTDSATIDFTYTDAMGTITASVVTTVAYEWSNTHGWADNSEVQLGTGNDLRFYHDGTNSYIRNDTGELRLQFSTTVGAAIETSGAFDVRQQFQLSNVISPAQLVANTNNWAPTGLATCTTIRLSTDAARDITGITAQPPGTKILLCNIGTQNAVLKHDVTSTAANRFLCPGSVDFTLNANDSVYIWYDTASSRWRVIAY